MTNTPSMKIRAIGGASVIALSAGFSATASAQMAPSPVQSVPTPATPVAPGNVQECEFVNGVPQSIVCRPGTDPDGFQEPNNSIAMVVEAGSQVQGEINLLVGADVTVDGDIVITSGDNAIELGDVGTVVNNGFLTSNIAFGGIVSAGERSDIVNNGTITTAANPAAAIIVESNSTVLNNGLLALSGGNSFVVLGGLGFDAEGVSLTNSSTGQILVDSQGVSSAAVNLFDGAIVVNDGLIQAFGDDGLGISVGDDAQVTNSGIIITAGAGGTAIFAGENGTVANTATGQIFTGGDNLSVIEAGANATVTNDGIITASGNAAQGIEVGANSTVTNTGQIGTTGATGFGVRGNGPGTLINSGLIQTTNGNAIAVIYNGDATIENSGTILAIGAGAVDIGGVATITNTATGVISGKAGTGIEITNGDGSTIANDGVIESDTVDAINVDSDGLTVTNNGIIRANVGSGTGIVAGDDFTLENTGEIIGNSAGISVGNDSSFVNSGSITGLNSDGILTEANMTLVNAASGVISGQSDGLKLFEGVVIDNAGTITGQDVGISAGVGTITNSGTIEGGNFGVFFDGATFAGGSSTDPSSLLNLDGGVVSGNTGVAGNTTQVSVTNLGTIEGTGGTAVSLDAADNTYIEANDGVAIGTVDGGGGTDVYAKLITDQTDRMFDLSTLGTSITNFEDIRIGSQTFDFATGMLGTTQATGVFTLTGTATGPITIVNTAILDGTINGAVDLIVGADDGINSGTFSLTENGAIATSADGDVGFTGGDGTTLNNSGSITTTGMATAGVLLGEDSAVNNTGSVRSEGTNGVGVVVGTGSTITNAAGATITTTGVNGFGIIVTGDGTLNNNGIVAVSGAGAQAVTITGAAQIANDGTIAASGGRAIDVALASTISNTENGTIASGGGDAIRMNAGGSTTSNAGTISTTADGGIAVLGVSDSTVNNSGSITTEGNSTAAILLGDNATVNTQGTIRSTGTNGVAIALGNNANLLNTGTGTITTTGDNGFGVVIDGNGTVNNESIIAVSGAGAQALTITGEALVINSGTIAAADGRAIDVALASTIANTGTIGSSGTEAIRMNAEGSTTSNAGTITTDSDGGVAVRGTSASTVNNSGSITTSGMSTAAILLGSGGTVNNQGAIGSTGTQGIAIALGDGGTIVNAGTGAITSTGDNGPTIVITGNGTITNEASISATGADAQAVTVTGDVTITNSGTISGDSGRAIDVAGVATIENAMGGTITSTSADGIRFGSGSTLTNRGTVSGMTAVSGSGGDDTVVNFGAIEGGVSLGSGSDEFQQWTGASFTGDVDLGGDDDVFILEGTLSSVTGTVLGGGGSDTAILAGVLDSDNLGGFETVQLGSTLGGTLDDLDISGNRSITGDVVHVGIVNVGLGVDSLTTTGSITLESTGVLNIATPLDAALVGQTVLVLQDGTGFTNNGATINILDDDLFLEYTPIVGSLSVRVNAVNPLFGNADPNIAVAGSAVRTGIISGTLSAANFAALNALPDANALGAAITTALPSLSDGVGREIFESGSVAGHALNRHLAGGESGVWGQITVRGAEQDALSQSANGYESEQLIFTAGGDIALGDDIRVGLMVSYADIDVEDETATGAPGVNSDVESIRLGAYAGVTFLERGFINTEISYLTGEVDTFSNGALGAIGSNYDFDGFATRATVGYDLLPDENVSITPTIGLNAARINFDDTLETGGFGFTVQRGDAAFVELRAGAEFGAQVSEKVSGFIGGTLIRDLIDDPRSFRVSSTQIPGFALSLPLREQDRFELAAGASVDVSESFVIELGYIGDFNSGYNAHSARASVRVAF